MAELPIPDDAIDAAKRGQTIEAIKCLREATGCDLLTAKQAIEDYLAGMPDKPAIPLLDEMPAEAVNLLEQGKLIDAIRVIRNTHGTGLKDAKGAAEQYLATHTLVRERYQAAAALSRNAAIHTLLNALLLLGGLCALLVWLGVLPWPN